MPLPKALGPTLARDGRFSLAISGGDLPTEALQGTLSWRDGPEGLWVALGSPLGNRLAELGISPGGLAWLVDSEGRRHEADDIDALVQRLTGMPVPVAPLRQWLREPVALLGLNSAGWTVLADRHDALGPLRLIASRDLDGRRLELRLVLVAAP
jgi:outer membrane lipoprotein LolB